MAEMTWDDLKGAPTGRFESTAHYDHDSDSLTVFISDDESYRERVDPRLTVYRSMKTNSVVGCQIKNVKRILSTAKAFNIGVTSHDITIGILLMALPLSDSDSRSIEGLRYTEIIKPIAAQAGDKVVPELESVG